MIVIDIPADLNMEDDEGLNVARLADAGDQASVKPGAVLVAGAPGAWSWAIVEKVDESFVHLRQISAADAARHGPLVAPLSRSA
jgi:hypothetical protein